ncbi:MAG: 6-phosphogluconolactonase [Candidatus Bathyarchaeota archaeon]|nr:6-phosphogluconolactonase [Candidatus Bathyarchaeota archaeon]
MVGSVVAEIQHYETLDLASKAIAKDIRRKIKKVLFRKNEFNLAISGGNTPNRLFTLLGSEYKDSISWQRVHIFWGDERCVQKDHPDSNYTMAYNNLISKITIPNKNIHRIITELKNPHKSALDYEELLKKFFSKGSQYTFDLMLLGMGEDGHTASLFPKSPILKEEVHWVSDVIAPSTNRPRNRITLTIPVINRSESIFFLISGKKKITIAESIFKEPKVAIKKYPAAMIRAIEDTTWYVAKN